MPKVSLIYRNVFWYRLIMNFLYTGGYKRRYNLLIRQIKPCTSIVELCFGDILLAEFCKKNNIQWTGFDINETFVKRAVRNGFNAIRADINEITVFPKADLCLIAGSLYHFADNINDIFRKILESADRIIISEPVKNLSDKKGLIGYIAKHSANSGKKHEMFRYNELSFLEFLEKQKKDFDINYRIIKRYRKDIIIEITK